MWVSGITQGLMLNGTTDGGTLLAYPNFLETLNSIRPLMATRIIGGSLYLVGWCMLIWNIWKTVKSGSPVNGTVEVHVEEKDPSEKLTLFGAFLNPPVIYSTLIIVLACTWAFGNDWVSLASMIALFVTCIVAFIHLQVGEDNWAAWYDKLLINFFPFTVLVLLSVLIGGLVQIVPLVTVKLDRIVDDRIQVPYTPLELAGRDIYVREGCYTCHSQMIRPFVSEILRYGDYSRLGESIYDHPYQWGSKRTGPDLARVGGKYSDIWHFQHMADPRKLSSGSNMPRYPWLFTNDTDTSALPSKLRVQRILGVPYPELSDEEIATLVDEQAEAIAANLASDVEVAPEREIIALIAFLQQLGQSEVATPGDLADTK